MLLINTLTLNAVYKTRSHHDSNDDCNSCAHQALADLGPSVEVVSLGSLHSDCSLLLYHRQLSISVHWKITTSKLVQTSYLNFTRPTLNLIADTGNYAYGNQYNC